MQIGFMTPLDLYRRLCLILMQMRFTLWRELEGHSKRNYQWEHNGRIYVDAGSVFLFWLYKQTQLICHKQQTQLDGVFPHSRESHSTHSSCIRACCDMSEWEAVKWLFINWRAATFYPLSSLNESFGTSPSDEMNFLMSVACSSW